MRRISLRLYLFASVKCFAILFIIYKTVLYTRSLEMPVNWTATSPKLVSELKYILQWTSPQNTPFIYMGNGRKGFIYRNCTYTNCFVTSNRNYFSDITKFDVIAFAGPEVIFYSKDELPQRRSPHQKYVFANIEAAAYYPICSKKFNGYFNWTWTYKLDSDLRWGFMVVKDNKGNIVGPKKTMHWIRHEDMMPVSKELRMKLRKKTKAAAWFVSNCHTASDREIYTFQLNRVLEKHYNLSIDIYGLCGSYTCSRDYPNKCFEKLSKDYYFYLSFENTFSEDYVTEKLLNAVEHNTVPIVFGGANYSRFLPKGSYLDATKMNVMKMAKKMYQLINNFDEYVEYFKWTNHYSYHLMSASAETDEYCKMCELLNDEKQVKKVSIYRNLKSWWDPPGELCYSKFEKVVNII